MCSFFKLCIQLYNRITEYRTDYRSIDPDLTSIMKSLQKKKKKKAYRLYRDSRRTCM